MADQPQLLAGPEGQQNPVSDGYKRRHGIKGNYPNTVNMFGTAVAIYRATRPAPRSRCSPCSPPLEHGFTHSNTSYYSPAKLRTIYPADGPGTLWWPIGARRTPAAADHRSAQTCGSGVRHVGEHLLGCRSEEKIGANNAVAMAQRLGVHFRTPIDQKLSLRPAQVRRNGAPSPWGVAGTAQPLEIANAFATIAAEGIYCQPLPVKLDPGTGRQGPR